MTVEVNGCKALGFDTGLDSRSFAQLKFAQFISEPGFIVRDNGRIEAWKADGVIEADRDAKPTMVVWGQLFEGERLDYVLNENEQRDNSLAAITRWIKAVLALAENPRRVVAIWPCAAVVGGGGIFFAPPSLAYRCLLNIENGGRYVHPDLGGKDGAAFTAAAMLYHVLAGCPAFPAPDESTLHQDMREGNFMPIHFAAPGLNPHLAAAIQNALDPIEKRIGKSVTGRVASGAALLSDMVSAMQSGGQTVSASSLVQPLSDEERLLLEKEKAQVLIMQTASIKAKRFVMRNTTMLLAALAALVVGGFIIFSIAESRASRPTTAGMEPVQVIESYYEAIGELDHQWMEACVSGNAGKNDISMVINFFVISKMRQTYEFNAPPLTVSAREWQQAGGGPGDAQIFGVTDLSIAQMAGARGADALRYRADYILWVPLAAVRDSSAGEAETADERFPHPYYRSDEVTIVRKKGNWRIAEIARD